MKSWWSRMSLWALMAILLHIVLQQFVLPPQYAFLWAYPAHLLLWILSFIEHRVALRVQQKDPNQLGMAFMVGGMVKFFVGIIYLLPFLLNKSPMTLPVALWFFLPYFTSLVFQAKETVKLLNSAFPES